jgi:addiction module HigA family antidote
MLAPADSSTLRSDVANGALWTLSRAVLGQRDSGVGRAGAPVAIAIREITQQNMRPARESGEAAIEHGQKRPDHPGEVLLRDFLRPRGITQVEAARHLQISTTRLNEIIRGKRGVSADTAWRLGDWLQTGPKMWMDLQGTWDLWQARSPLKTA